MSDGTLDDPRSAKVPALTDGERALLDKLFGNWLIIPDSFKASLADYVSQNSMIPVAQIRGFSQTVAHQHIIDTSETRAWSSSYGDMATVGPKLENLGAGKYLVMYGAQCQTTESGSEPFMSIDVNGAGATDADSVTVQTGSVTITLPMVRAQVIDLTESDNSIVCKYKRIGNGTTVATFFARWLIALRIGNL